ncbi:hypothetical protein OIU78_009681, partial [Salix suchowensis]
MKLKSSSLSAASFTV